MKYTCFTGGALGENAWLLTETQTGESALIDPGFTDAALEQALAGVKLRYILLTHGHFDHVGGVAACKARTGAPVVCLAAEAVLLQNPSLNLSASFGENISLRADDTVQDGDCLPLGTLQLRVLATPGHTAGSCCYYTPGALFCGDTLMAGTVGRTDFPTGDMAELQRSLVKLRALPAETAVCCGHGPASTLGRELRQNPWLRP